MAQIDNLIDKMVNDQVESVALISDAPMQFSRAGREAKGKVISFVQLETIIKEITPVEFKAQLTQIGHFEFAYSSPSGASYISVNRSRENISDSGKEAKVAQWRVKNPQQVAEIERAIEKIYSTRRENGVAWDTSEDVGGMKAFASLFDSYNKPVGQAADEEIWQKISEEHDNLSRNVLEATIRLATSQNILDDPWESSQADNQANAVVDVSEVQKMVEKGSSLNQNGSFQAALPILEEAYKVAPKHPGLAFELGFAYNALKKFQKAADVLGAAINNEPRNYIHHRELAFSHLGLNKYQKSIKCYENGLAFCPKNLAAERSEMAANMAKAYEKLGRIEESQEWSQKAWEWAPTGSAIRQQLQASRAGKGVNMPKSAQKAPVVREQSGWQKMEAARASKVANLGKETNASSQQDELDFHPSSFSPQRSSAENDGSYSTFGTAVFGFFLGFVMAFVASKDFVVSLFVGAVFFVICLFFAADVGAP